MRVLQKYQKTYKYAAECHCERSEAISQVILTRKHEIASSLFAPRNDGPVFDFCRRPTLTFQGGGKYETDISNFDP